MPDVYLYQGQANPNDIMLANPTVPRGWWPGRATLTQEQNLGASGNLAPWGVVLYPMGALISAGSAAFRPIGSPVVRRISE